MGANVQLTKDLPFSGQPYSRKLVIKGVQSLSRNKSEEHMFLLPLFIRIPKTLVGNALTEVKYNWQEIWKRETVWSPREAQGWEDPGSAEHWARS